MTSPWNPDIYIGAYRFAAEAHWNKRLLKQPREIRMVKLADRITNLQPPPPSHWTPERITSYREEAVEILKTLKDASPHLAARLEEKIERY
jgi:hypothetical protein